MNGEEENKPLLFYVKSNWQLANNIVYYI
jgi:hypothetical protein